MKSGGDSVGHEYPKVDDAIAFVSKEALLSVTLITCELTVAFMPQAVTTNEDDWVFFSL